jgi:hypothetical protein
MATHQTTTSSLLDVIEGADSGAGSQPLPFTL